MVRAWKKTKTGKEKNEGCKLPIIKDSGNRYPERQKQKREKEKQNQTDSIKIKIPITPINQNDQYYYAAGKSVSLHNELKLPHVPSGLDLRRASDISVRSGDSYESVFSLGGLPSSDDRIEGSRIVQSKKRRVSFMPMQRPQSSDYVGLIKVEDKEKVDKPANDTVADIKVMKPEPLREPKALTLKDALIRKTETGDEKKKGRFKRLAKMVRTNLMWAKDLYEKTEHQLDETFVVKTDKEALTFDLNNFRVKSKSYGGISLKAKHILSKNALERTEDDLLHLRDVVDRLKCFDKYSIKIKHELARVIEYESFREGRIIIQQGHIGVGFYFILKGSVSVIVSELDKATGHKTSTPIAVLEEGQTFGELALMHDIKRAATIQCLTDCEFLRVDKPDFDMVLRVGQNFEWRRRLAALKSISIFQKLSPEDLNHCNNISRIVEFSNDTVIMGDQVGDRDYVYFVNSGKCKIVRVMTLVRELQKYGESRITLPNKKYLDLLKTKYNREVWREIHGEFVHKIPERHLMVIAEFKQGNFFGVGEDLTDTYIIAKDRVECLMMPRLIFAKLGKSQMIENLKITLSEALPKNPEIFEKYINGQRWRDFKECLVKEVVKRRNIPNPTNYADVPESILDDKA